MHRTGSDLVYIIMHSFMLTLIKKIISFLFTLLKVYGLYLEHICLPSNLYFRHDWYV